MLFVLTFRRYDTPIGHDSGVTAVRPQSLSRSGERRTRRHKEVCISCLRYEAWILMYNSRPRQRPHTPGRSRGNLHVGDMLIELLVTSLIRIGPRIHRLWRTRRAPFRPNQLPDTPLLPAEAPAELPLGARRAADIRRGGAIELVRVVCLEEEGFDDLRLKWEILYYEHTPLLRGDG